jgi:hypothetical protein
VDAETWWWTALSDVRLSREPGSLWVSPNVSTRYDQALKFFEKKLTEGKFDIDLARVFVKLAINSTALGGDSRTLNGYYALMLKIGLGFKSLLDNDLARDIAEFFAKDSKLWGEKVGLEGFRSRAAETRALLSGLGIKATLAAEPKEY